MNSNIRIANAITRLPPTLSRTGWDVWGNTVVAAARMEQSASANTIFMAESTQLALTDVRD